MAQLTEHQTFVSVVDEGSFSGAARSLGVSKSHVSKQIGRLEERLGARLLQRTTRRVVITEVGQAFYDRCVSILEDLEEAELAVSQMQSLPTGTLRLSVPFSFGIDVISPAICAFLELHDDLRVDLSFSDRYVDIVGEGFDMAVRIGRLKDSTLIARKLCPIQRWLCASPGYFKANGAPKHPEDLKTHEGLLYTLQSGASWEFTHPETGEAHSVKLDGRVQCNNGEALRDAAVAGLGVAMLPDFLVAEPVREGKLEIAMAPWTHWQGAIWLLYPHNRHLSAKVRLFVDFLTERVAQSPHDFVLSPQEISAASV